MSEKLPEAIGSYRIQAKLGQGGMGTVFKAMHETLERPAAVKLLPPEMAQNPEHVTRFLREARTVATLNHPNIVQVYDAGAFGGRYFIAMELVEGTSLGSYLNEKSMLSEEEGIRLLTQAARGLSVAHAKGLVHRDIKPENMLLDKDLNLHIVDFGLVMETASQTQLTATGACLGTPMYMSPEQTDGEKADARSDIYSLGVTFFRALAGTPPFSSPTVMNLLFKHRFESPPDPRAIRPELSENIANLLLTMMAKPREDRPQDGQALVTLLKEMQQGKKIPAPPPFRSPLTSTGLPVQSASALSPAVDATRKGRAMLFIGMAAAGLAILLIAGCVLWSLVWSAKATGALTTKKGDVQEPGSSTVVTNPSGARPDERWLLIEKARELEANGDLPLALAAYERAAQMQTDAELEARIVALKGAMQSPGGATDPVEVEPTTSRDPGMELARKAEQHLARNDYALAAVKYEEAAQRTEKADLRQVYRSRAKDCQRQADLREVETAEAKGDWAAAAAACSRALDLAPDPALRTRRDVLLKKAKDESEYCGYMQTGDAALTKGEYIVARVNYQLAQRIVPASAEAQAKLNEANGRLALQAGDEARARNDSNAARIEYLRAKGLCPSLQGEAERRMTTLTQPQFLSGKVVAEIDRLVRETRSNDAYTALASALRADPTNTQLLGLKEGFESLQACESLYRSLKPILQQGQTVASDVLALDADDRRAASLRDSMETKALQCDTRSAQARTNFLSRANDPLRTMVLEAKTLALTVGGELDDGADRCRHKAAKAADFKGVNTGFFKIGVEGDKDKADKYTRTADSLSALGRQAKALSQ
jgi:hypothetical protein